MKKFFCLTVAMMMLFWMGSATAGEYTGPAIKAKFASEEYEGDFMTVWGKKFADEMRKWSDGKIDITVYAYGELGDTRDINELCQYGVVDFVFSDYAWISSFVPQAQVLGLHYFWPREKFKEVLHWVIKNGEFMKVLEEKFRYNGLVPLSILPEGWQWITSNKPINSIDDMNRFKIRLMSSKMLVAAYSAYGTSPTPMSYGEVYSALQTGLVEGQANPLFAIYSAKFFEVQDYFTQIYAEPFTAIPTVNMKFFDSLPKNAQDKMKKFWADAVGPATEYIFARNQKDLQSMLKERPNIKVTVLSDDKLAAFKEKAKTVHPEFLKLGGKDAQKVLDTLTKDVANAKNALGIK